MLLHVDCVKDFISKIILAYHVQLLPKVTVLFVTDLTILIQLLIWFASHAQHPALRKIVNYVVALDILIIPALLVAALLLH